MSVDAVGCELTSCRLKVLEGSLGQVLHEVKGFNERVAAVGGVYEEHSLSSLGLKLRRFSREFEGLARQIGSSQVKVKK